MTVIDVYIIDESTLTGGRIKKGLDACVGINVVGFGKSSDFFRDVQGSKIDVIVTNHSVGTPNIKNVTRQIIQNNKIPVIALVESAQEAREVLVIGVNDSVVKVLNIIDESTIKHLAEKIRMLYNRGKNSEPLKKIMNDTGGVDNLSGIIAIGASTGGTEATTNLLSKLPKRIPGVVVTQHMMDKFIGIYAQRLDGLCALDVKQANDGDLIVPGRVLIAPGDKHMAVKKVGNGYGVKCYKGRDVSGHCPSVDVLFESVADACGRNAVGIILTGMGEDGARGLKKMYDKGAFTIGQSEAGCCVYGMPQKAYELGGVKVQRALNSIPGELMRYLRNR